MLESEYRPENRRAARLVAEHARARGVDPATFAFAWVLADPSVTAALAGPRTLEQWQAYRPAAGPGRGPEDEAVIDGLVKPGTTCLPQYADPSYPIEGRTEVAAGS